MTDYDDKFEELWNAYPKRNGKKTKKLPAYKKWLTLDAGAKAQLSQSIHRHNRDQTWGKYIRDMVTYINQAGWDDEVDDPKTQASQSYHFAPEPAYHCSKWEAAGNRLFLKYLRTTCGLPDDELAASVHIKNDWVREASVAFGEDLEAGADPIEVSMDFARGLMDRLDKHLDRSIGERLLVEVVK